MILSNIAMQEAMEQGRLVIDPRPEPLRPAEGRNCPYDTHSVNLRLGQELSIPIPGTFVFDLMPPDGVPPGGLSAFLTRNAEKHILTATGYPLRPQSSFWA